jgi:hypothetical protein
MTAEQTAQALRPRCVEAALESAAGDLEVVWLIPTGGSFEAARFSW